MNRKTLPSKEVIAAEFNGVEVSFSEKGWFDATLVARQFDKDSHDWLRLPSTQEYLEAFLRKYGKISYLKTVRGKGGGTWLHPKLAIRFAQWLNVDFAVWCDDQIDQILRGTHPHYDKLKARHEASASFKVMNEALRIVREEQGKTSQAHHYSNKARLINYALSGEFGSLDRASLEKEQLDTLAQLEIKNTILISRGIAYQDRKKILEQYAIDLRVCQLPLIGPIDLTVPQKQNEAQNANC
jgi:hypothetical protein